MGRTFLNRAILHNLDNGPIVISNAPSVSIASSWLHANMWNKSSETEKEVLIKVLYKDIYDAVGTISKKNLAKLTEALINKTKNAQLVALIKAGELEK